MFNIFDEVRIGMAAKAEQDRLWSEAELQRLLSEAQSQVKSPQENEVSSWAQFLALAFKAFGTNGQIHWKL